MKTNALPKYDASDNTTGCCPRFIPDGWDDQELHFDDKLFVKVKTASEEYVPTNMGEVFTNTFADIENADAHDDNDFIVLSRDVSASEAEHFFAVTKPVPDQENVRWNGNYLTKLFEGPYEDAPKWEKQFKAEIESHGSDAGKIYYFYTTCPKCAQAYGKNYIVAVAELTKH